jgi:hypothetical protein
VHKNSLLFLASVVLSLAACGSGPQYSDSPSPSSIPRASATGPSTVSPGARTPTVPSPSVPTTHTPSPSAPIVQGTTTIKKSISNWVSCNGVSDDSLGVASAFAAAKGNAFTLIVDCPVYIHSGLDIARVIYIDDGTTVEFTGAGKFTIDNVMHPAFVIANSSNINLTNWDVEYDASLPANPDVGGFADNGQFVAVAGRMQPTGAWNDRGITPWLTAHRAIIFDKSQGGINSEWASPTNTCAAFFITGDTSNVTVTGMNVHVPTAAGGDRFVPVVFSISMNFKSKQTVTAKTPRTAQFFAVPHDLTFSNITFDGTYMGWVGGVQNVVFENIRSHRYGDLQDAKGENVGGVGKWFAPPHLFYLNYAPAGDPALFNRNIQIKNVVDDGPRIGTARDKPGTTIFSGNALSLKIGCLDCSVDTYKTTRPDGFLDVLPSDGLTISNVDATFDSTFLNNYYPGWRFPSSGYANLTFENISLKDTAVSTVHPPIDGSNEPSNENVVLTNVQVGINRWSGAVPLLPNIIGHGNEEALDYTIAANASRIMSVRKENVSLTLQATPATLSIGGATLLTWTSKNANSCSAGGAWSGARAMAGSRTVQFSSAGNYDLIFNCQNASASSSTTLPVVVQ